MSSLEIEIVLHISLEWYMQCLVWCQQEPSVSMWGGMYRARAVLEQCTPKQAALLAAALCDFDRPSSTTSSWAAVILEEKLTTISQAKFYLLPSLQSFIYIYIIDINFNFPMQLSICNSISNAIKY